MNPGMWEQCMPANKKQGLPAARVQRAKNEIRTCVTSMADASVATLLAKACAIDATRVGVAQVDFDVA